MIISCSQYYDTKNYRETMIVCQGSARTGSKRPVPLKTDHARTGSKRPVPLKTDQYLLKSDQYNSYINH